MEVEISPGMDKEEEAKLECRACLELFVGTENLYNLFLAWSPPWKGMHETIAEDLTRLTDIKVSENDQFSPAICGVCCKKLKDACTFIHDVQHNDSILKQRHAGTSYTWPKPIQLAKNVNDDIFDTCDKDIKEEANSDYENDVSFPAGDSVADVDEYNLDIKLEPEEQSEIVVNDPDSTSPVDDNRDPLSLNHRENGKQKPHVFVDLIGDIHSAESDATASRITSNIDHLQNSAEKFYKYIDKYFASGAKGVKEIMPPCSCIYKCFQKFTIDQRKQVYQYFWSILPEKQWEFILKYTTENKRSKNIRTRLNKKKKVRESYYKYFLPTANDFENGSGIDRVCKQMFINTLSCSSDITKRAWDIYKRGNDERNEMSLTLDEFIQRCTRDSSDDNIQCREKLADKNNSKHDKKLGPPCVCKFACYEKISMEQRLFIFEYFWNLGNVAKQWAFVILNTVIRKPSKIRKKACENNARNRFNCDYFLPSEKNVGVSLKKVRVCKVMFQNTLAVGSAIAISSWEKYRQGQVLRDKRGIHQRRPLETDAKRSVCDHFNEIHKLYKGNSRKLMVTKMYSHYLKWFDPSRYENKVNIRAYRYIVNKLKLNEATEKFEEVLYKSEICDTSQFYLETQAEMPIETVNYNNIDDKGNRSVSCKDLRSNTEYDKLIRNVDHDQDDVLRSGDIRSLEEIVSKEKTLVVLLTKLEQDKNITIQSNGAYVVKSFKMPEHKVNFGISNAAIQQNLCTHSDMCDGCDVIINASDNSNISQKSRSKKKSVCRRTKTRTSCSPQQEINVVEKFNNTLVQETVKVEQVQEDLNVKTLCLFSDEENDDEDNMSYDPDFVGIDLEYDSTDEESDSDENLNDDIGLDDDLHNHKRVEGLEYNSSSGKMIKGRTLGPVCDCKNKCRTKISEEQRNLVFTHYWSFSDDKAKQRSFVKSYLEQRAPLTYSGNARKKCSYMLKYYLPLLAKTTDLPDKVMVCQKMFENTLACARGSARRAWERLARDEKKRQSHKPNVGGTVEEIQSKSNIENMAKDSTTCDTETFSNCDDRPIEEDQYKNNPIDTEQRSRDTDENSLPITDMKTPSSSVQEQREMMYMLATRMGYLSNDSLDSVKMKKYYSKKKKGKTEPKKTASKESRNYKDMKSIMVRSGKEYVTSTGKIVKQKMLGPPCYCSLYHCADKLDEVQRMFIFDHYWNLGTQQKQWEFLKKYTVSKVPKRHNVIVTKVRKHTYTYYLPITKDFNGDKVAVCQTMFLSTIAITTSSIYTAHKKTDLKDRRGSHIRGFHPDVKLSVKDHVHLLLDLGFNLNYLDYCKKRSKGIPCVKPMTYQHMYDLYNKWFDPIKYKEKVKSLGAYQRIANIFITSK